MDILTKPVFCAFHVHNLRNIPYELYQLQSGKSSLAAGGLGGGAGIGGKHLGTGTNGTGAGTGMNNGVRGMNDGVDGNTATSTHV